MLHLDDSRERVDTERVTQKVTAAKLESKAAESSVQTHSSSLLCGHFEWRKK